MAELALADRMRISHSHLRGGAAVWTTEDVEKALAFRSYEAGRCGGCGSHREDWKDGARPLEAYAYRCGGCEDIGVLQFASRDVPQQDSHGVRYGLRVPAEDLDEVPA